MILNFVKAKYKFRNCIVSIKSYSNRVNSEAPNTLTFYGDCCPFFLKCQKNQYINYLLKNDTFADCKKVTKNTEEV